MTHGSLFSGIGGFDLAAEWMGWENKFHCEWNDFGKRILNYYWPKAISYGDITKTDFTIWRGRIDILTGGFPCQPYSAAGKRLGKADERHLWPEMLRAIREIQPRYVVGENVYGIINWNGGVVFNEVQADLEALGYQVQPIVLPACAVNAPHRRDRVWFVAYNSNPRPQSVLFNWKNGVHGLEAAAYPECTGLQKSETDKQQKQFFNAKRNYPQSNVANSCCTGLQRRKQFRTFEPGYKNEHPQGSASQLHKITNWREFPTVEPTIRRGNDGISSTLDFNSVFEGIPFPKKPITFAKWKNESIKAYGNAIVPQVAFQIFKAIQSHLDSSHFHF